MQRTKHGKKRLAESAFPCVALTRNHRNPGSFNYCIAKDSNIFQMQFHF